MFKVNEYYQGKVKSIAFESEQGPATIGLMAPGEYEFATAQLEIMQVISGNMKVKLPGKESWEYFKSGQSFTVPADSKFQLKIESTCAYLCLYK